MTVQKTKACPERDVFRGKIEIPQCAHIFKTNYCLKVHKAHLKLASPISGQDSYYQLEIDNRAWVKNR